MKNVWMVLIALMLWGSGSSFVSADGPAAGGGRVVQLTLVLDYEAGTIRFDGTASNTAGRAESLDLTGFPLRVEQQWPGNAEGNWNIIGTIEEGEIVPDPAGGGYQLRIGSLELRPRDELRFTLPFVNLDYDQISPRPDPADGPDEHRRAFAHRFSYKAGQEYREIPALVIPFAPIDKRIDLVLTPLMGETWLGRTDGLRFSGRMAFESLVDYKEFGRHCQSTSHRLIYGDYRIAHLLASLDHPHYTGFAAINADYQFKPTAVELSKSELTTCQYEQTDGVGRVEAAFSGRISSQEQAQAALPQPLQDGDSLDGNYPFEPEPFRGVQGYELRFGKIMLAPGDVLTVTVPHVRLQADVLEPSPTTIIYPGSKQVEQPEQIIYHGPRSFDLSIKYVPDTRLWLRQFPAVLRPGLKPLELRIGDLVGANGTLATWLILVDLFFLVILLNMAHKKNRWLGFGAWFLGSVGFLYGMRGSFGLLFVALAIYLSHAISASARPPSWRSIPIELAKGVVVAGLMIGATRVDQWATMFFRDLSTADLSPLTPVILAIVTGLSIVVLYGWPGRWQPLKNVDLIILAFLLVILATHDALDKSLLALTLVGLAGLYLLFRLDENEPQEGDDRKLLSATAFRRHLTAALADKRLLIGLVILIVFAVWNDLTSTYATELHVAIPWLLGPLLSPLLIIASTTLNLISFALLFILLYPAIPSDHGYIKAILFALFLLFVFLLGLGTDDRLIAALPTILVGRGLYYLSVPLLIGIYFDIVDSAPEEPEDTAAGEAAKKRITIDDVMQWLKPMQGRLGAVTGLLSIVAPSVYAFFFDQPTIVAYFSLLEALVLLPV